MPTNRKRVSRNAKPEIEAWKSEYLKYEKINFDGMSNKEINHIKWGRRADFFSIKDRLPTWEKLRSHILSDWIEKFPCTRPYGWRDHDAPRQNDQFLGWFYHGTLPEPMLHVGGGELCKYNYVPRYEWGVFRYWHYDEGDPPMIESEAAYLQRLELLTDRELKNLKEHVELLEPVPLTDIGEFMNQWVE